MEPTATSRNLRRCRHTLITSIHLRSESWHLPPCSCPVPAVPDSKPFSGSLLVSLRSLSSSLQKFFSSPITRMYHAYRLQVIADRHLLIPHTLCGVIALLAGPVQFSSRLRQRHLKFHRVLGRVYVISVFIGALTGIALAAGRPGMPGTCDAGCRLDRLHHRRLHHRA